MNVVAVVAQQENVEAVVAAVKKAMSVEAVWRERADSVWNH